MHTNNNIYINPKFLKSSENPSKIFINPQCIKVGNIPIPTKQPKPIVVNNPIPTKQLKPKVVNNPSPAKQLKSKVMNIPITIKQLKPKVVNNPSSTKQLKSKVVNNPTPTKQLKPKVVNNLTPTKQLKPKVVNNPIPIKQPKPKVGNEVLPVSINVPKVSILSNGVKSSRKWISNSFSANQSKQNTTDTSISVMNSKYLNNSRTKFLKYNASCYKIVNKKEINKIVNKKLVRKNSLIRLQGVTPKINSALQYVSHGNNLKYSEKLSKYKLINSNVPTSAQCSTNEHVLSKYKRNFVKSPRNRNKRLHNIHLQRKSKYSWKRQSGSGTENKLPKNISPLHRPAVKTVYNEVAKQTKASRFKFVKNGQQTMGQLMIPCGKKQVSYIPKKRVLKQYISIYKSGTFFNNSQKRLENVKNQSSMKFRVIKIDGKVYHSSQTSLKRRSSSLTLNNEVVNCRRNAQFATYRKENKNIFQKSSLKPGMLIEILHKRRMNSMVKRNEFCKYYQKYGQCQKHQRKLCPFVHRKENVPVCTRFLGGDCQVENCPFSHEYNKSKMPVCSHFINGSCTRENCHYRHIKVNPSAPVCHNFLRGNCSDGENCKRQHIFLCEEYEKLGRCSRGRNCPLNHRKKKLSAARANKTSKIVAKIVKKDTGKMFDDAKKICPDTTEDNCPRYFDNSKVESAMRGTNDDAQIENGPHFETSDSGIDLKARKRKLPDQLPSYLPLVSKD